MDRSAQSRVECNFFEHRLVQHLEPGDADHQTTNIDSDDVRTPCHHFGVVLQASEWRVLANRLIRGQADFYSEPQAIVAGQFKELQIMLEHDAFGNIVEFKGTPPRGLLSTHAVDTSRVNPT